jgi:hypothetical protein
MTYKVSLLFTEKTRLEPSLGKMIQHLEGVLKEIEGVDVKTCTLTSGFKALPQADYTIFCGYDHVTLAYLHLALDKALKLAVYDEPGKALQTELGALMYRGVDSDRIPPGSLSAVEYFWSYKDIVGIVKQNLRGSGNHPRTNRTRQVEDAGDPPSPEGNAAPEQES